MIRFNETLEICLDLLCVGLAVLSFHRIWCNGSIIVVVSDACLCFCIALLTLEHWRTRTVSARRRRRFVCVDSFADGNSNKLYIFVHQFNSKIARNDCRQLRNTFRIIALKIFIDNVESSLNNVWFQKFLFHLNRFTRTTRSHTSALTSKLVYVKKNSVIFRSDWNTKLVES